MKYAFLAVLYNTPKEQVEKLKKEIRSLNFPSCKVFLTDNSLVNKGLAAAMNRLLKKVKSYNPDVYVFINTDLSIKSLSKENFEESAKHFDLWGFAMKQDGRTYYGGELDRWRMSGALLEKKPKYRFIESIFVPGPVICAKKKVVEAVGEWDERFFLYYEDVDYCLRAKKAGFKVGVDTHGVYSHFEVSKNDSNKRRHLITSRLKFLLKHGSVKQKLYELIRLPKTLIENRPFVINFLTLNSSSFFNKLLNFVLFIFLVKYLSVENYGIYTLVWAHIALLQPFLDFGTTSYGLLYLPGRSTKDLSSLFSLRLILASVVFTLTLILANFLGYQQSVFTYIFLTSFTLFTNAVSGSLLIYASLKERLIIPSLLSIGFNLVLITSLITNLIFNQSLSTLFVLVFIFYNIYTLINFIYLKASVKNLKFTVDPRAWFKILRRSLIFLMISLFAGLYFKLDVFLLNFLKGPKEVGVYSAGYKFLEAFLFLAASYNIISTPVMSRLRKEAVSNLVLKIKKDILYLFTLGISVTVAFFVLSPYLLPLLFRKEYVDAIPVLRIVIWGLPFILVTSVFFNSLYVLGKAKIVMWLFILQTIFNVTLNILFIPQYSYIASSYITIIGEVLNTLITSVFVYKTLTDENIS